MMVSSAVSARVAAPELSIPNRPHRPTPATPPDMHDACQSPLVRNGLKFEVSTAAGCRAGANRRARCHANGTAGKASTPLA